MHSVESNTISNQDSDNLAKFTYLDIHPHSLLVLQAHPRSTKRQLFAAIVARQWKRRVQIPQNIVSIVAGTNKIQKCKFKGEHRVGIQKQAL
jgi:hypothetical protein